MSITMRMPRAWAAPSRASEVGHGAVGGIYVEVIGDVVAVVHLGET